LVDLAQEKIEGKKEIIIPPPPLASEPSVAHVDSTAADHDVARVDSTAADHDVARVDSTAADHGVARVPDETTKINIDEKIEEIANSNSDKLFCSDLKNQEIFKCKLANYMTTYETITKHLNTERIPPLVLNMKEQLAAKLIEINHAFNIFKQVDPKITKIQNNGKIVVSGDDINMKSYELQKCIITSGFRYLDDAYVQYLQSIIHIDPDLKTEILEKIPNKHSFPAVYPEKTYNNNNLRLL
jgi:hypothetical protein